VRRRTRGDDSTGKPGGYLYSARSKTPCIGRAPFLMKRDFDEGISLASESVMSEITSPSTYNEPTVIWRMRHADGRSARAVIDPMSSATRVLWFVDDQPLYVRYFADWTGAIEWSNRLRAQQWTVGWRLVDITDSPTRTG
jgi:hypothetical protein